MSHPPVAPPNTLDAMLARKAQLDDDLRSVERMVYECEEAYLEETQPYGNVVRGWDGFLTARPKTAAQQQAAKGHKAIPTKERIFSLSSVTAPLEGGIAGGEEADEGETATHVRNNETKREGRGRATKMDDGDMSD